MIPFFFFFLDKGSTTTTTAVATTNSNNINNNNSTTSNGINGNDRSSNSLSSSATTATVTSLTNGLQQQDHNFLNQSLLNGYGNGGDRICFNFGKELFVYAYRGVKKVNIISYLFDCFVLPPTMNHPFLLLIFRE